MLRNCKMSAMMPGESVDTSVLEEFTTAKRKIGEIFEDIDQQVEAVQVRDLRTPSWFQQVFCLIKHSEILRVYFIPI